MSARKMLLQPSPLSGPYKRKEEQHFFKYFVEVTAPAISRSRISVPFWRDVFPQVAWHLKGTRYALLAMSMGFDESTKDLFARLPEHHYRQTVLDYESRAMSSVNQESPSVEGVLVTSMAFWMISLITGNYSRSLQHCYFIQKILYDLKHPEKCNPMVLQYCTFISETSLEYFRATRGPCVRHPSTSVLDCEASCFVPEDHPLSIRVANTLLHLREALPELVTCRELFNSRTQPHTRGTSVMEILDKLVGEVRFLIRRWADYKHLGLPKDFESRAKAQIPFTLSPFTSIMTKLRDFIEEDESASISFPFLDLQIKVTIPNLCIDTSQGPLRMIGDLAFMLFHGGVWENKMYANNKLREDLVLTMMKDWTTEEERSLFFAANELCASVTPAP